MLEGMRKNAKLVIYIVAVVFILSMAIGGISSIFISKPFVGKIAGRKIHYEEYSEMLKNAYANYAQENPDKEIDEKALNQINNETWNNLVAGILYNNEIKRLKIKVTDDKVLEKLKNPGEDITSVEQFQTDGKFDYQKYLNTLSENPDFAAYMEARIRGNLPYEILFETIKSEINLTEEEIKQKYIEENDKVDVSVVFFDPKKIEDVEVTEEEIKDYYEENKEDYKRDPSCKYKYVKIPVQASESDINLAKTKADSVYNLVKNNMDFAEAAMAYSEGPTGPKGGDLGYFSRGRMVPEFETATFKLKVGEISEPVLTQFGWHIIKVFDQRQNDKGEEEVKASHILITPVISEKTKSDIETKAWDFYEKAEIVGIDSAAVIFSYEAAESREFLESAQYISGIGRNEELIKYAFGNKAGTIHEPFILDNGDYLVAQISEKLGVHYQDFEEVKAAIERTITGEKQLEIVFQKADEFFAEYDSTSYLRSAKSEGWEIVEGKKITIDKNIGKIRAEEELNQAVFTKEDGQFTDLIKGERGAYLAKVEKRYKPDMEYYEQNLEQIMVETQEEEETKHLSEWYQNLRQEAEIEDNRSQFFDI